MARKKADSVAKIPVPEKEDAYRRDHLCFVLVSLGYYSQDLEAKAEIDPEAAEVAHAMGVAAAWLNPRIYEASQSGKKGLPPGRPSPGQ